MLMLSPQLKPKTLPAGGGTSRLDCISSSHLLCRGERTPRKQGPQRRNLCRRGKGDGAGEPGGARRIERRFFDDLSDGRHVQDRSAARQPDPARRVACRLPRYFGMPEPSVGSIDEAWDLLYSFRKGAARIAHASLVTAAELSGRQGSKGRPRLDWYDDFTATLLDIAN